MFDKKIFLLGIIAALFLPIFEILAAPPRKPEADSDSASATRPKVSVTIEHRPPKAEELAYPGQIQPLVARLANSKKTDFSVRLVATRDGRAIEQEAKPGFLDKQDKPTYEVPFHAPKLTMSYQFLAFDAAGDLVATSPRYSMQRSCLPRIEAASPDIGPEIQGEARLKRVSAEVANLQNDLDGYARVHELLADINKEIELLRKVSSK